jgi:hypothetical protein
MNTIFALVFAASLIALLVGLRNPGKVRTATRGRVARNFGGLAVLSLIGFGATADPVERTLVTPAEETPLVAESPAPVTEPVNALTPTKPESAEPEITEPVTNAGYGACLTEDLFDQWVTAFVDQDQRSQRHLLENGCIILRAGLPISVLDRNWTGVIRARIYAEDGDALEVWTYQEAVRD